MIGGGRIALYLAWALDGMGMHITIVEQNEEKCMAIAEKLPKATILHGDGTDHDLLESEGIFDADAFVSLTGRDEENLLMALTAKDSGVAKVLPKMSRPNYTALVHDLGIDTVISPKDVTASQISSYVRGLANSQGSAVESLHKILGGAMEAVEFTATRRDALPQYAPQGPELQAGAAGRRHRPRRQAPHSRRPLHHLGGRPRDRGGKISVPQGPQRHSGPLSCCTEEGAT